MTIDMDDERLDSIERGNEEGLLHPRDARDVIASLRAERAEVKRLRHACKSARDMLRVEDSDDIHDAATFLDEALGTAAESGEGGSK